MKNETVPHTLRATELPWLAHPFGLISWLEMLEFSAYKFFNLSGSLEWMRGEAERLIESGRLQKTGGSGSLEETLLRVADGLRGIGCKISAKAAARLAGDLYHFENSEALRERLGELRAIVSDEMKEHLFLWVPSDRADFYSKTANDLAGAQCVARFPCVTRELEESAKCYALGRYTACAFHLMRSTEAGVKALAKAINSTPTHRGWGMVFKELERQSKAQPPLPIWQTHRKFLNQLSGDLVALTKAWRNDVAHLVDTYTEEDAKNLLAVISMFLRDLAANIDENGKLY